MERTYPKGVKSWGANAGSEKGVELTKSVSIREIRLGDD